MVRERQSIKETRKAFHIHSLLTSFRVHLTKSVVAHLVHQAVEECRTPLSVHPEFPAGSVVIEFLNNQAAEECRTPLSVHPEFPAGSVVIEFLKI